MAYTALPYNYNLLKLSSFSKHVSKTSYKREYTNKVIYIFIYLYKYINTVYNYLIFHESNQIPNTTYQRRTSNKDTAHASFTSHAGHVTEFNSFYPVRQTTKTVDFSTNWPTFLVVPSRRSSSYIIQSGYSLRVCGDVSSLLLDTILIIRALMPRNEL